MCVCVCRERERERENYLGKDARRQTAIATQIATDGRMDTGLPPTDTHRPPTTRMYVLDVRRGYGTVCVCVC